MGGNASDLRTNDKQVTKAEVIKRDIHSGGQRGFSSSFINHQAVRLTTRAGKQYIIETGPSNGSNNPVSVTDASKSNDRWQKISEAAVTGKTVDDFIKSADPDRGYSLPCNNCQHAVKRMINDNVKK